MLILGRFVHLAGANYTHEGAFERQHGAQKGLYIAIAIASYCNASRHTWHAAHKSGEEKEIHPFILQ